MQTNSDCEIFSSRILNYPVKKVFESFADPNKLKLWWGPEGFTNTIHQFDLKPGGSWVLTMHGPENGHYENASIFKTIIPFKLITWERTSKPLFDMEIAFEKLDQNKTKISFKMIFDSFDECQKMKKFIVPKNEENFDRLERELLKADEVDLI